MDIWDKFRYLNTRQKILFITTFVLVIAFLVILIVYLVSSKKSNKEEVIDTPVETIEVVEEPIVTEEPVNTVVPQTDVINSFLCAISNINDVGTKAFLTLSLMNDTEYPSVSAVVTTNTEFLDGSKKIKCNFSDFQIGDMVVVYVKGNYQNVTANIEVLMKSNSLEYNYAELKSIVQYQDAQQWVLQNTSDTLLVDTKSCDIIDGYSGESLNLSEVLTSGAKILFRYSPDFQITETGNMYSCEEIIILYY